jgi:hypothetical protein
MVAPNPLLTNRAVVLSKIEATYNVDAVPTPAADAMLVSDPDYTVDPTVIARNFSRFSLSALPHRIGRKLAGMKFGLEWKGSGDPTIAPKIGRHMRGCGYAETQVTAGAPQVGAVKTDTTAAAGPVVAWSAPTMGANSPPEPIVYKITVTTAGASGVAKVSITPDANAVAKGYDAVQGGAGVAITSATPLSLRSAGAGAAITPTWAGNLVLGQTWWVVAYPLGWLYTPVSTGFESLTHYMYLDGKLHKMPGGRGTFTMEATAGGTPMATFTYTGQYVADTDAAVPLTGVYEGTLPPIVELANLTIDEYLAVVNRFSFDQSNALAPRSDVSNTDGYNGVIMTGREPKGGIDPEATLVANEDFWGSLASAEQMLFRMRLGNVVGNRSWVIAPATQYTGLTYANRDSIRVLDAGLKFPQWFGGDDEISFFFG